MADNSTSFSIDLAVKAEGVSSAAELLDRYADRLTKASQAATAASDAVKAGEASYKQAETTYDRASKALEKIGLAADKQRAKMKAALDAGDASSFWKAATAAEKLKQAQADATQAAASAKKAMEQEAGALDKLRTAAAAATKAEEQAAKVNEAAKKAAGDAAKAAPTGKINEAAEALGKLGGPVGALGQKGLGAATGLKKLTDSFGTTGALVGVAAGFLAIAAAVGAVAVSAGIGIGKIALWGVQLADKTKVLDRLQTELGKNIAKTFGGLKITKLLEQLGTLVDLFDSSTESGHAMKVVFESIFQPIVDGATGFIPVIRAAFFQFEILVLKALIAIKPFGSKIVAVGKIVGEALLVAGAAIGAVIVVVLALVGAFLVLTAGIFYLEQALVGRLANAWTAVVGKFNEVKAWLANFSLVDLGLQIIQGLANGITSGAGAVVDSVKNAATGALNAAKKTLGIASPSRVFAAEVGDHIPGGIAMGVSRSGDQVGDAIADVAAPSALEKAGGSTTAAAAPAAGGGGTYNITINASGNNAAEIAKSVRTEVEDFFASLATQSGAGVPA